MAPSAPSSWLAGLGALGAVATIALVCGAMKATQGAVALENCHPFVRELWGRYWVFAHNGNLENFHPRLHAAFRPVGATDSERAFCWLMQEFAKSHAGVPDVNELTLTENSN